MSTGQDLGVQWLTSMPALTDVADIQEALMMLWYGGPNATQPVASRGIESFFQGLHERIYDIESNRGTEIIIDPNSPDRDTDHFADWIWIDSDSVLADGTARPIYFWGGTDWIPASGVADESASYDWTGNHTFSQPIVVKAPINYFDTDTDRTTAFSGVSMSDGILSYLGSADQLEFYADGQWHPVGKKEKDVVTSSSAAASLQDTDGDKVLVFSGAAQTLTVPSTQIKVGSTVTLIKTGTGTLTITPNAGVTVLNAPPIGVGGTLSLTKTAADYWVANPLPTAGGTSGQAFVKLSDADYSFKWQDIVPAAGGTFTGPVTFDNIEVEQSLFNDQATFGGMALFNGLANFTGGFKINGRMIYVSSTQPTDAAAHDLWIEVGA